MAVVQRALKKRVVNSSPAAWRWLDLKGNIVRMSQTHLGREQLATMLVGDPWQFFDIKSIGGQERF